MNHSVGHIDIWKVMELMINHDSCNSNSHIFHVTLYRILRSLNCLTTIWKRDRSYWLDIVQLFYSNRCMLIELWGDEQSLEKEISRIQSCCSLIAVACEWYVACFSRMRRSHIKCMTICHVSWGFDSSAIQTWNQWLHNSQFFMNHQLNE